MYIKYKYTLKYTNMELTKQEINSYNQGKSIISEEQMAVCYLIALNSLNGNFPTFTLNTSIEEVFIYSGMNKETLRRTTEKFKILLLDQQDDEEITNKEVIYPKLVAAYNKFLELSKDEIYYIANESFTEDNKKIGLAIEESKNEKVSNNTKTAKDKDSEVKIKLRYLFNTLNGVFKDSKKAKRQTINKISEELNMTVKNIKILWNKDSYLKDVK